MSYIFYHVHGLIVLESSSSVIFFFFFQAEDGIRDLTVTGVQTCALPISISIVSNLFFLIGTNMGERFVYITSLGFCLAFATFLIKVFKWDSSAIQDRKSVV